MDWLGRVKRCPIVTTAYSAAHYFRNAKLHHILFNTRCQGLIHFCF